MSYESAVAQLEQTNAQLVQEVVRARDAIMGLNRMYATIVAGRDAVKTGEYFTVPSAGIVYATLYRKTGAGTQEKIAEFPSREAFDAVASESQSASQKAQQAKNDVDTIKQKSPTILIKDQLRSAVEAQSGGRNTVVYTAKGEPCYMYVLPRYNLEDLPGWNSADGTGAHPAFIRNGVVKGEILIGLYQAAQVGTEAVSQPYMTPKTSINYDNARALCKAAGSNFDMMGNWDWSAVAMWCVANGFQPRGNSDYGRSHANRWETGRLVDGALELGAPDAFGKTTLTGSGPNHWRHDDSMFGIADLVGNVWEWNAGFKLVGGVAHIAPDNGIYTEEQYLDTGFSPAIANPWSNTSSAGAPAILKQALIVPSAAQSPVGYGSSVVDGERLPLRGGYRAYGGDVGLGALNLSNERTNTRSSLGFRPIFRT